jgi:hypothetical protein
MEEEEELYAGVSTILQEFLLCQEEVEVGWRGGVPRKSRWDST